MSEFSAISNAINSSTQGSSGLKPQELGQADFLKLMVEQLRSQDPMQPMENGQFLGQLAQFSTVSGIQDLQSSFSAFAQSLQSNQALQAATLVGHKVMVAAPSGVLTAAGTLDGAVNVPAGGTAIKVQIADSTGKVVRTINLGAQPAGIARFQWDGRADDGKVLPPGTYALSAQAKVGGKQQAADTYAVMNVDSVKIGTDGLGPRLHLGDLGDIPLSQVESII